MCVAHILLFRTAEMIQMIHFQLSIYVGFYYFFLNAFKDAFIVAIVHCKMRTKNVHQSLIYLFILLKIGTRNGIFTFQFPI